MISNPYTCFDPALLYKPQFAYATPPGFRDEPFWMPITFRVLADGLIYKQFPVNCDDDVPWIFHAIVFPQLGTGLSVSSNATPGLCLIRDTYGNPLQKGMLLALGPLSQSGFESANAFGFPLEPAVECAPGGSLTFDFQLSSNAGVAQAFLSFGGLVQLFFLANVFGTAGNAFTVELIDPGAPNIPLSVAVVGGIHLQVTLATDGAGVITSTAGEVAVAVNSSSAALAIEWVLAQGVLTTLVTAVAQTALTGGSVSTEVDLHGTLLGFKRFREC